MSASSRNNMNALATTSLGRTAMRSVRVAPDSGRGGVSTLAITGDNVANIGLLAEVSRAVRDDAARPRNAVAPARRRGTKVTSGAFYDVRYRYPGEFTLHDPGGIAMRHLTAAPEQPRAAVPPGSRAVRTSRTSATATRPGRTPENVRRDLGGNPGKWAIARYFCW
jgi:hypothetical protein